MINVYTIRNWLERIDNLVKHNQWDRAFALALSFYKGEARAVVGLAGSVDRKKMLVADKIIGEGEGNDYIEKESCKIRTRLVLDSH